MVMKENVFFTPHNIVIQQRGKNREKNICYKIKYYNKAGDYFPVLLPTSTVNQSITVHPPFYKVLDLLGF